MDSSVYVKVFKTPDIKLKEILRYAGVREQSDEINELLESCLKELSGKLTYKVCYRSFPVSPMEDGVDFSFSRAISKDLKSNLTGCRTAIVFAATIGIEIDRLITRYTTVSPVRALLFQAIGAERIESLCDEFCEEMKMSDGTLKPRFSPGYGDLPLEFQKEIFRMLDCPRKIGVSLNSSLLMSPSKSVTAIVGISDTCEDTKNNHNCEACRKTDCAYRR